MRKQLFLGAMASLLLTSCLNEPEVPQIEALGGVGRSPLQISVNEDPFTKATGQVSGTSLGNGAEIGVFVTASDGTSYDSQAYDNVKYTATGTGGDQTWAVDESKPVLLSSTKGKVYAYYPRQASGVSLNSITISSDGNDWMYTPVGSSEVSLVNPTAQLGMEHAMTIIRVKVVGGNASSGGTISSLTLDGSGWATSATLDLQNGTIGSYTGEGASLVANDLGTLNTTGVSHDFWVVSKKTASTISFKVSVGSDDFVVSTPTEVTLDRGKVYNYTLNVETSTGAQLSSVSLTDWTYAYANLDLEQSKTILTWEEAKAIDGVYGITSDNKAMVYDAAKSTEETLTGVALVMNGKAIEIAPSDASAYTTWAATSPMSAAEQAHFSSYYITTADGSNSYGYVKMPNGSYYSSNDNLSDDISTWALGALADVDGKANTDRILAAGVTIASVITSYNNGSHGNTDWYLPTAGQLAYMFMNKDKINNLLAKVSGTYTLTTDSYWSSSVYSEGTAWLVGYYTGYVKNYSVTYTTRVRLARDL